MAVLGVDFTDLSYFNLMMNLEFSHFFKPVNFQVCWSFSYLYLIF